MRIADNTIINILANPESTVPVIAVRIRNQRSLTSDDASGGTFVSALVAEAAGEFEDIESAVELLANLANPYFQSAAVAANAAIDDPQDMLVFAPPKDANDEGEFLVQRAAHARSPAPLVRDLPADAFAEFVEALGKHHREDRIHRAMAHYRLALEYMTPQNWVLSAEALFVAVENLARVVLQRLLREEGLPDTPQGKHDLAVAKGFVPRDERDRSHLGQLDSWIRQEHIFSGDEACYRNLLDASDAFEHGHEGFDHVRALADKSTAQAFGYIREAILKEVGVPATSTLFGEEFRYPLADWKPVLELAGTYTDSNVKPIGMTPETAQDAWPDFLGPSVFPKISQIEDKPEGRELSLTAEVHTDTLSATQTLKTRSARWVLPGGKEEATKDANAKVTIVLNGKDVTEDWLESHEADDVK